MYLEERGCAQRMVCFSPSRQNMTLILCRSTLSKKEKLNYIDAVKCINEKPALTPSSVAAGAKSRFDDFVVTHVKQTYWVHGTVR
jgi:hypothetical protein